MLTPPLPCPHCRALVPMRILSWQGRRCQCRPECDAQSAAATTCCTRCQEVQQVGYNNEGAMITLDEWLGPAGAWHVQSWPDDDGRWAVSIMDPPDGFGTDSQWLAEIADLLDKGAYSFPLPKERA